MALLQMRQVQVGYLGAPASAVGLVGVGAGLAATAIIHERLASSDGRSHVALQTARVGEWGNHYSWKFQLAQ